VALRWPIHTEIDPQRTQKYRRRQFLEMTRKAKSHDYPEKSMRESETRDPSSRECYSSNSSA